MNVFEGNSWFLVRWTWLVWLRKKQKLTLQFFSFVCLCQLLTIFIPFRISVRIVIKMWNCLFMQFVHWSKEKRSIRIIRNFIVIPSPFDSILEAVLTVSPNKQYLGIVNPTTPATTAPINILRHTTTYDT